MRTFFRESACKKLSIGDLHYEVVLIGGLPAYWCFYEIQVQQTEEYTGGENFGCDEERLLHKGEMCFLTVGTKKMSTIRGWINDFEKFFHLKMYICD